MPLGHGLQVEDKEPLLITHPSLARDTSPKVNILEKYGFSFRTISEMAYGGAEGADASERLASVIKWGGAFLGQTNTMPHSAEHTGLGILVLVRRALPGGGGRAPRSSTILRTQTFRFGLSAVAEKQFTRRFPRYTSPLLNWWRPIRASF